MVENFLKYNIFEANFAKVGLRNIVQNYTFLHISNYPTLGEEQKQKVTQNIQKSKIMMIDQNDDLNKDLYEKCLIIGFEKTVIILNQSCLLLLGELLSMNPSLSICFLSNTKSLIVNKIVYQNHEIESNDEFLEEIENFNNSFRICRKTKEVNKFWFYIVSCVTGYLIKKCYIQEKIKRTEKFLINYERQRSLQVFDEDEYVELRTVGTGSIFICTLIYHLMQSQLYVIKKPYTNNPETEKLMKREVANYLKINHRYLPKFYGRTKNKNYLVIEYIHGHTLKYINKISLTSEDILTMILELMLVIHYFHKNNMIYRDLKPDNVMIDSNKTIVLIDHDRLIDNDECFEQTLDIGGSFAAPEIVETKKFSFASDIYSLGKIIEYIIEQIYSNAKIMNNLQVYSNIKKIIDKCINKSAEKRPSISKLIQEYIFMLQSKIIQLLYSKYETYCDFLKVQLYELASNIFIRNIYKSILEEAANENDSNAQLMLGYFYFEGIVVEHDIKKSIQYLTIAANQNISEAQFMLGKFHFEGIHIKQDINKAIQFFSLAANLNNVNAQCALGFIYLNGIYVAQDIRKAIHYLSLASNQNEPKAQFFLGNIFIMGFHTAQDIKKGINYWLLSANQNYLKAQLCLGIYYYEGKYTKRDINKSIYYFTLASKQNDSNAQYYLGVIYYLGMNGVRDITKAFHYFSLAANQNNSDAQYFLGVYYSEGKYIKRDINKSIYYLTLAANQNDPKAQFCLGVYYYEEKFIKRDMNKSIYYFTCAANQNNPKAQYNLACFYAKGEYIERNIEKAIHYFQLAANQNMHEAYYGLGIIYYFGDYGTKNIKKGLYYIILASKNGNRKANFIHGFLLHEGNVIQRNIQQAIHYYKEASSFNNQYAKNNLGIIYKNGFGDEIAKNSMNAIIYFDEAIRQSNDILSMYNLAHLYIYNKTVQQDLDKSIDLLIRSSDFNGSVRLLCIALIKKYGFAQEKIKNIIIKHADGSEYMASKMVEAINYIKLLGPESLEFIDDLLSYVDFVYDANHDPVQTTDLNIIKKPDDYNKNKKNISSLFYEGFGYDLD